MASIQTPNTPWFAATIGLFGLIVGYALANGFNGIAPAAPAAPDGAADQQIPEPTPTNLDPASIDDDAVLGDKDADITVIEFTDYQCPFCSRHYTETFSKIKEDYIDTGKVKYVVRDFALSFHPNAQKAAETTECAADQGKFWEMHSKLFSSQDEWSSSTDAVTVFKKFAKDLGMDSSAFDSCLDSSKHAEETLKDMQDGSASGIDGTPGFWIIGPDDQQKQISGAYPYDTFKAAFDEML